MRTSVRKKNLKKLQKYLNKKQRPGRGKQCGWFLNRYDFGYAGRNTVNQATKGLVTLDPKVTGQAPPKIDKITEAKIRQVINDRRQQIQKIVSQIIRGAIEDVYKTPFRLLGKLGKQTFSQLKRKLSKIFWEMTDGKITDKIYHSCVWRKKINLLWKGRTLFMTNIKSILERTKRPLLHLNKEINKK